MARDIGEWLDALGLGRYAEAFADNEIDLHALPHITEEDLKGIGVALGARRKLLAAIAELGEPEEPATADERSDDRSAGAEAERRQLTVMFVDLVGSTALAERLDPEDLREVIRAYQKTCAEAVGHFEGHIAKYIGDGLLVYFGYPQAHEDDAQRAVSAGLGIVEGVGGLNQRLAEDPGVDLGVRVGVHTGLVVAGEMGGGEMREAQAIVGETPNVAARIEGLAEPNTVAISAATLRLIEGLFECDDLGPQTLKGISEPVRVFRVRGESAAHSRFEATAERGLTPLVGREEEIGLLLKRWAQAKDGEGQVVLLSGEAGVGKSRIVQGFRERLEDEPHSRVLYYGSPYHRNSALYPATEQLQRALRFERDDGPAQKLDKLEAVLGALGLAVGETAPPLAALLSLPLGARDQAPGFSPQELKERTLESTIAVFEAMAAQAPVLMVVEDAHWIDPSTIELLSLAIDRLPGARLLLLITFRPEFGSPWAGRANLTQLALNRLGRRDAAAMVANVTGGKALPDEVLDQIIAKTDGVPLYVEELTKAVLESGLLAETEVGYALTGPLLELAIPSSLQDSLMARLDRLAPVKEVAQLAAVIGRGFSHELLAAASPLEEAEIAQALDTLVESGLVYRRGLPPLAGYEFKHALVRDAAYQSLLKSTRQQHHRRIAEVLAERIPAIAKAEPEVLAHHYTEGGLVEMAIPYWQRAGQRAAEHSADAEAIEHLRKALKLLEDLPEDSQRWERELKTLIVLGPVLMNTKGSASPDVRTAYLRARDLCDRVGQPSQRFPVLWGLWLHYHIGGDSKMALGLAHEAIELAEGLSNDDFLLQAHHAAWTSQTGLVEFGAAVEHANRGLELYDLERHRDHAFTYGGHDPGVCAAGQVAIVSWFLGYPEQSLEYSERALELARARAHTFSTAHALNYAALLCLLRREPERALRLSGELITFSSENSLTLWRANGQVLRSWARAEMGEAAQVLDEFREAMEQRQLAGSQLRRSLHLAAMAHALTRAGMVNEAEKVIEQALDQLQKTGERCWETFIYWVRGIVIASTPEAERGRAAACYQEAGEIALRQRAKSMELRAVTSLAKLRMKEGERDEAREMLAPVYGWFTEGFDTPDLKDAKALLDELA